MPRKKTPIVWCVPSHESSSNYHEVSWASDGDLNKAYRRGHHRRFRLWAKAKEFARAKAKQLGVKASIHPY